MRAGVLFLTAVLCHSVDQGSSTTDIKEAFRERIKDYVDVYRGVAPADVVEEAQVCSC